MFEKASRLRLRFMSPKGMLSVEDLWDLPLTSTTGKANLDDIARTLDSALKSNNNVSFVVTNSNNENAVVKLQFDIVLHIISTKIAENEAALKAKGNREKKQQLLEILERKQNAQVEAMSADEIRKMIEAL